MTLSSVKKKIQQVTIHVAWSRFKGYGESFWVIPTGYTHKGNAIRDPDGNLVTDTPVVLLQRRRYVGQDLTTYQVAVLDEDRVHLHEISAEVLFDPRKVIKLLNYGIRVDGHATHKLVRYLRAFDQQNQPPTIRLVTQIGLYREGALWGYFLHEPHGPMPDVAFHPATDDLNALHAALKPRGDSERWCEPLKLASKFPRVMVTILAALYPLVRAALKLPVSNFTLHHCAGSSTGKTTACRLAVSIFADPYSGEWLPQWRGNINGVEALCLRTQGLPVFLQDSHLVTPEVRRDAAYSIGNGQWKARGGKRERIQAKWDGVVISTGEGPLISEADPGGAAARCIMLYGSPFGQESTGMAQAINQELLPIIQDNYGHATLKVLNHLFSLSHEQRTALVDRFRYLQSEYTNKAAGRTILGRQAEIFAGLHLTAEVLQAVLGPWCSGSPTEAVGSIFEECAAQEDPNQPLRVYDAVAGWVLSNLAFCYRRAHDVTPNQKIQGSALGLLDEIDNTVSIFPDRLREFLSRQRFPSFEELAPEWKRVGLLIHDKGHYTNPESVAGHQIRMVTLRLPKKTSAEGAE